MTFNRSLVLSLFFVSTANAQISTETHRLFAADGQNGDFFGSALAIDGAFAVCGAPRDGDAGPNSGSVYVLQSTGGAWTQTQKLAPSTPHTPQGFGASVAIHNDTILVGATNDPTNGFASGTAYVFRYVGGLWVEEAQLFASDAGYAHQFGYRVALDNNTAVVTATKANGGVNGCGAAYVFERNGTSWTEVTKLSPATPDSDDDYGFSVDVEGTRIAVGAPEADWGATDDDYGEVELFELGAQGWTRTAILRGSQAPWKANFGNAVSLSGDRIAIGAYRTSIDDGRAYVFHFDGTNWVEEAVLEPADNDDYDSFGHALDLDGDRLVVSARSDDVSYITAGSAYLYERSSGSWGLMNKLLPSDGPSVRNFGESVAIDGGLILVGTIWGDGMAPDSGSAYLFESVEVIGTSFCFGDGSATTCPCIGNHHPDSWSGCLNSTGEGAILFGSGSASLSADDLEFQLLFAGQNRITMLMQGTQALNGGLGSPFGDGLRCVGGPLRRFPAQVTNYFGHAVWGPGQASLMGWNNGQTIFMQAWYRDGNSSSCAHYNTSNALQITLLP